jgi:hypothetical protein
MFSWQIIFPLYRELFRFLITGTVFMRISYNELLGKTCKSLENAKKTVEKYEKDIRLEVFKRTISIEKSNENY